MRKSFMLIALITLGIFATIKQAQAKQNIVYFQDRNGEEVEVGYSGSIENPRSIWFKSNCDKEPCNSGTFHHLRLLDLASAIKRKAVYQYINEGSPCSSDNKGCSDLNSHPSKQNRNSNTGVAHLDSDISAKTLATGMANGQGTNVKVIVVKTSNNSPVGACIINANNECSALEEVIFSSGEDGDVTAGMLVDPVSSDSHVAVMVTLMDYMRHLDSNNDSWKCRTLATEALKEAKWSILCGYKS